MFKLQTLDPEKLAWLAGLFQAEAYFYLDTRIHSKSKDPDYTPPPPVPNIKLDMVEKDLMEHVADLLEQSVKEQRRKTTVGKTVYRVSLANRSKVEAFLKAILPYVVGKYKRDKIQELLNVCDQYNLWFESGGRSKAGALAARMKTKKSNW